MPNATETPTNTTADLVTPATLEGWDAVGGAEALRSHADDLLDEEYAVARRANVLAAAPTSPPVDLFNVVCFDPRGNVIFGEFTRDGAGIDWSVASAASDGDTDPAAIAKETGAKVYGVYNLRTGEAKLYGSANLAQAREWAALVKTLPEVPPAHPDPEAYRATRAASPTPAEVIEAVAAAPTFVPAVAAVAPPTPDELTPADHLTAANVHWGAAHRFGLTIDIPTTMQGILIAADAVREHRAKFPASTPGASIDAVAKLHPGMTALRHLLACYHHLVYAAAGGADVSEALEALGEATAELRDLSA